MILYYATAIFAVGLIPGMAACAARVRPSVVVGLCALLPPIALLVAGIEYDKDAHGGDLQGAYTAMAGFLFPAGIAIGGILGLLAVWARSRWIKQ